MLKHFSRPYLSNGQAIGMVVVRPSVCLSVRPFVRDVYPG